MTAIEWTDQTWNPVTGCSKVSAGCDNCYAETLSLRFGWSKKPWTVENAAENVVLHPERLRKPLSWRKPSMVFVNSMSDLFHERIPDSYIDEVFAVMLAAPRHTFQVLTKRPERASEWFESYVSSFDTAARVWTIASDLVGATREHGGWPSEAWPLPNVWLGTSIESWRFNHRADQLRRVPAAVRFISAEPLLDTLLPIGRPERRLSLEGIDWLIVGGESGRAFRPMEANWVRELRDYCERTGPSGTAFFFKQWGGRTPKAGGRELDGREWSEYPTCFDETTDGF